jgi:hypothetical protein
MKNNAKNNGKQRKSEKLPGGITGKGFQPGYSGNPNGRPRTRGLVSALKTELEKELEDGRTVEEALAQVLIEEGLHGRNRLAAVNAIFDRLEGKPKQSIDVRDAADDDGDKSYAEIKEELKWLLKAEEELEALKAEEESNT